MRCLGSGMLGASCTAQWIQDGYGCQRGCCDFVCGGDLVLGDGR